MTYRTAVEYAALNQYMLTNTLISGSPKPIDNKETMSNSMPVNNLFVTHAAIHMYYTISVYQRSVFIYNNVLVYKSDISVHAMKCVKR